MVRCFNVLFYFDRAFREQCLKWVRDALKPDGLFLCGSNAVNGSLCKYSVYLKEGNRLVEKEFALSIENLRPMRVVPWFALHDDDCDACLLADVVKTIRSNSEFITDFDGAMDSVLSQLGLCPRGEDGYLGGCDPEVPTSELGGRFRELESRLDQDGYVDGAVAVLRQAGYEAWRNCVGHIAFTPDQTG